MANARPAINKDPINKKIKDDEPVVAPESRDARVRSNLISHINGAIARIETAQKRWNDANASLGTADRELQDARKEYATAYDQLHKHLPSRDNPTSE